VCVSALVPGGFLDGSKWIGCGYWCWGEGGFLEGEVEGIVEVQYSGNHATFIIIPTYE
jgi:hypothetical protein